MIIADSPDVRPLQGFARGRVPGESLVSRETITPDAADVSRET
jgi:hypothetical protein